MTAEFDWWLLIVGLVVGAGLVWLVSSDSSRHDDEIADDERSAEAAWIALRVGDPDRPLSAATVEDILREHRAYLGAPPPDEPEPAAPPDDGAPSPIAPDPTSPPASHLEPG